MCRNDTTTTEAPGGTASTTGLDDDTTASDSSNGASTTGPAVVDCDRAIVLPDPSLFDAVRNALGVPEATAIFPEQAKALEHLGSEFAKPPIVSLEGLQCFGNLRTLSLNVPEVADLGPLAELQKLESIHIWNSKVADLSPLAGLPTLWQFILRQSPAVDFGPLAGHSTLTSVQVAGATAPLTDLQPFAAMPALIELHLIGDGLQSLGGLSGAPALTTLQVNNNALVSLAGLEGVPTLQVLQAERNLLTGVEPLAELPALQHLRLASNQIADPASLGRIGSLRYLDLRDNPLTGLTGLESLPGLLELSVEDTNITALVPVSPTTLTKLLIQHNAIVDLSPIAEHQALEFVTAWDNAITSLEPLLGAPWLLADHCAYLNVELNPLDDATLDVVLPQLCEAATASIAWERGSCSPACSAP